MQNNKFSRDKEYDIEEYNEIAKRIQDLGQEINTNDKQVITLLLSKGMKNMNRKFFHLNKDLQFIKIPIISKYREEKIIPFRNTDCMRPKCIYELIDVLELFQKMLYNKSENFRCNFCSELVFLNGFYRDITLEEAVNNI